MSNLAKISPGKYWVIHLDSAKEVDLVELNGSPYGSYMYCKSLQCVFYANDIFTSKLEATSIHNKKIVSEIMRMESYINSQRQKLILDVLPKNPTTDGVGPAIYAHTN